MDKNLFSSIRFRQILNDLKRRPEDAAIELGLSLKKIKNILNGSVILDIKTATKIIKIWPVQIDNLINHKFLSQKFHEIKIFKKKHSIKTARIMKRKGKDYYEYRDTVMDKFAPFRPEWIRTICRVNDNDPKNKNVVWNKGHLLHQFTYFVGKINFYYLDEKGNKKTSLMNTGDSMYISPYVPHSFASRDNKQNYIIALTYLDKVTPQLQDSLSLIGEDNIKKILININNLSKQKKDLFLRYKNNLLLTNKEIKKRYKLIKKDTKKKNYSSLFKVNLRDILGFDKEKKVKIKKNINSESWFYPENKKFFKINELASSKFVPEAKSIKIEILKNNKFKIQNFCHQYAYVLSDNLILKHNSKTYNLQNGDTFYLKPFTKFSLTSKNSLVLILRIPGNISGDNLLQLSQLGEKNILRVFRENQRWY